MRIANLFSYLNRLIGILEETTHIYAIFTIPTLIRISQTVLRKQSELEFTETCLPIWELAFGV